MMIDWLTVSQEHKDDVPIVSKVFTITIDAETGDSLGVKQPWLKYEGSYSTSIKISVSGNKVRVDGNPSRVNRLDNLFGHTTIDQCIHVYNAILRKFGLPEFTKCTQVQLLQSGDGCKYLADGAVIERIDLTTNMTVGEGNVLAYLRALSTQRIGHSVGYLYPNGRTVDWAANGKRKGGMRLQYRKAYDKAFELAEHLLPKVLRTYGEESDEYQYVWKLHQYCNQHGVVRMEQGLKAEFLSRENLKFWGLFDEKRLKEIHEEFLKTDEKLKVTKMDLMTISGQLVAEGIVESTRSAMTTAMYAIQWSSGHSFDLEKAQVKVHRARLRKIGIDIANTCDTSRFTPVIVRSAKEITKSFDLVMPDWYRKPNHLRAVA